MSADPSRLVLILGSFVGVDILSLSDNKRYEFLPRPEDVSWKGGQSLEELKPPFLCLELGQHLFDPSGWVFGSHSDSDICDIQLTTDNQTGISRRTFRIDICPDSHHPRLKVLSDMTVRILDGNKVLTHKPPKPLLIENPITIDLTAVSFRAWLPTRTRTEARRYNQHAAEFSSDLLAAVPKFLPSLGMAGKETKAYNVRYGKNGAVYVNRGGSESRGMNATVMEVTDISTQNIFGAKQPFYNRSDSHDVVRNRLETLRMEFEHIMHLDHVSCSAVLSLNQALIAQPHILKAYEVVVAEDVKLPPWMIVEYIPQNLLQALRAHSLDEHDRQVVLEHVSSGLEYMHACGITHRDVKPDNILVQRQEKLLIKLADFGTSKRSGTEHMDTFAGTPMYMAPEMFEHPSYTNKVDIWAFGLVALQLLTKWDPAMDKVWNTGHFGTWMREVVSARVAEAPAKYSDLLKNLFRREARRRWSAKKCHAELVHDGRPAGAVTTRKRSASALGEDAPSARLRPTMSFEHHSDDGGTVPNTPSFVESVPASAAPTPRPAEPLVDEDCTAEDEPWDGQLEDDWS